MPDSGSQTPGLGPVFGLTGGVATGKSTAAQHFHKLGAYIIDADRIGHELIQPEGAAFREVVNRFGTEMLDAAGRIDRQKLGPAVFADPQLLHALNAIVHPRLIARIWQLAAAQQARDPHSVVIVDAALIFEWGIADRLRKVMVAWCRPEQQLERLMAKAGITRKEAERRVSAQIPVDEKRRRADYLIDCSGTLDATRARVDAIYPELRSMAGQD